MKRLGMIVMAGLLVLGLAQCKKEQTNNTQSEGNVVRITLNVDGSGSRVNVDPTGIRKSTKSLFENGDQILVGTMARKYVGTLDKNGYDF